MDGGTKMVDEAWNETLAYIQQKAPPESNRKKVLTGLKQQQYITQFINQNTNQKMPEGNDVGSKMVGEKGWGKVR
jgi:hypothetical protein